jgi:hypothetical protein
MATGFTVENQIPLNPPFLKGDFKTLLWKGGQGDFRSVEDKYLPLPFSLIRHRRDACATKYLGLHATIIMFETF